MSDSSPELEAAIARLKSLGQRPDNTTLLKLYGLYKQATEGDVTAPKPGFSDLVGRAKWQAWADLQGTPRDEAERRYIELADSLA